MSLCIQRAPRGVEAFVGRRHGLWAGSVGEEFHPRIERVLAHLAERWRGGRLDAPGSDELAAVAGVTRAHLGRLCRAAFGCSPQELLRGLRLDRAALLLARTDLRIATIAERCGFACPYHFSRSFRARAGCAPRAYRERLRAGGERGLPTPNRVRRVAQRIWER